MIRRAARIFREQGPTRLLARGLALAYREGVRPRLPAVRRVRYAGLPTAVTVKPGDGWVPDGWVPRDVFDIPEYEATLLGEIRGRVRPGDRVVVVGGGVGVTAAVAAERVGSGGSVRVFEGARGGVRDVLETVAINGVAARVEVTHAVVGRAVHVYGRTPGGVVHPADLPDCDVLELDCEGAEVEILRAMTVRPRVVLVETHGLYGAPTATVVALLREIGYDPTVVGHAEPRIPEICETHDIRVVAAVRAS